YPLVKPTYVPDKAAGAITPGLTSSNTDVHAKNTVNYLSAFPYLGTPHAGFFNPSNNAPAPDLGALNICSVPQVPVVPTGAPETGQAPVTPAANNDALIAGGVALAAAAVAAGVATRPRTAPAVGPDDHADAYTAATAPDESAPKDS
ncbi:MAG: hypothetical protein M3070_11115, partial [Actinomycetota bacterium]|nr:hypothetical protein [Actinomycetota bacterium]